MLTLGFDLIIMSSALIFNPLGSFIKTEMVRTPRDIMSSATSGTAHSVASLRGSVPARPQY